MEYYFFNIADKLREIINTNHIKDQPAMLKPKNCHGISAQFPSPINSAFKTSANGKTSIMYSRGGPHNGTSSSGRPWSQTCRPEIQAPAVEKRAINNE